MWGEGKDMRWKKGVNAWVGFRLWGMHGSFWLVPSMSGSVSVLVSDVHECFGFYERAWVAVL